MAEGGDNGWVLEEVEEAPICAKGGGGNIFPLIENEYSWPRPARIFLYMAGLAWCFMGVAIISDVFMGAIEKVTSKKVRRRNSETGRYYTFEIWNPTVANLTLMALGSSAPEILLNVIDIFTKGFFLEGLGPSTIVGSAAFNLLLIIAVCIVAIPNGEIRSIKEMPVYIVTASFSLFAYLWLIFILLLTSPNVVEVWEGVLTFLFFPILCGVAFFADIGGFGNKGSSQEDLVFHEHMSPDEFAEVEAKIRQDHGAKATEQQIQRILAATQERRYSRAHYRVSATRELLGGKRVWLSDVGQTISNQASGLLGKKKVVPIHDEKPAVAPEDLCYVEFELEKIAVLECVGQVSLKVKRKGNLKRKCTVRYRTEDGTARKEQDYIPKADVLNFEEGQDEASIAITIVNDIAYEEDEDFFIHLSDAVDDLGACQLGTKAIMQVVIIDDDDPGVLSFCDDTMTVPQKVEDHAAEIRVVRAGGSCGTVTVSYQTEAATAVPGQDYEDVSGELTFEDKQVCASIFVVIKQAGRYECTDSFRVVLTNPKGGAKLDDKKDGGATKNILTVTIEADDETKRRVEKMMSKVRVKWEKSKIGHANWMLQFRHALLVNGGEDGEGMRPSAFDMIMHFFALPWKILFALVPPTDYCGGWVCFVCALVMIGLVTAVISEVASCLGCVMCIPDDITAITFVAMGTSLPDTFASRTAAVQDPDADASVGNVTGSNSVNVFLGLGLPWMVAAVFWQFAEHSDKWQARYQHLDGLDWLGASGVREQGFVVMAGSLAYSVSVFSCCAVACICLLALRRTYIGGELGGPRIFKWLSFAALCTLWLTYIVLSSVKSLQEKGAKCVT